ncbi:MAG: cytosine permease, partial [Actinomycetota bacterium]
GASLAEEVAPVDSPAGGENLQSEAEQLDSSSPEFDEWSETKQQAQVESSVEPTFVEARQDAEPNRIENVQQESAEDIAASLNASYAQSIEELDVSSEVSYEETVTFTVTETPEPISALGQQEELIVETSENPALEEPKDSSSSQSIMTPTRRPSALVWSWLALSATPLGVVLAGFIGAAGASFPQAILILGGALLFVAVLASMGSVASKRGSSSVGTLSRAAFGVWGNAIPSTFILLVRFAWLAVLIIWSAKVLSPLISNQPWFSEIAKRLVFTADFTATALVAIPLVLISAVMAGFGGITMLKAQQVNALIGLVSLGAIGYFVISSFSVSSISSSASLSVTGLMDLGILVVALFGFMVFTQSGDFARKLDPETPGAKVFFVSLVSTFFPPLVIGILSLVWVYAASGDVASELTVNPLLAIVINNPLWLMILLTVGIGISIIQILASSAYSIAGELHSIGIRIPTLVNQIFIAVIGSALSLGAVYLVPVSELSDWMLTGLAATAVLMAAYCGIVVSDALLRRHGYHEVSLTREYGFYGKFNFVNIFGLLLATALGFGYLKLAQLPIAGFLADLTPGFSETFGDLIGIAMAFGLGLLFPIVLGIPRIKKQEENLLELEQRRAELKEFLNTVE